MAISSDASWLELASYAFGKDLQSLLEDTRFTNAVRDKHVGARDDTSFHSFVEFMTDLFHDHFSLAIIT